MSAPAAAAKNTPASPTAKAAIELPPGAKEMMTPVLTKAQEALQGVLDLIKSSKVAEMPEDGSMPGVPEELWQGLVSVVESISKLEGMYPKAAPTDEETPDDAALEGGETADMQMALKQLVTKVGAKMSKERLSRFSTALDTLASILGELQTGSAPAPAAGAPAAPPLGKGAPPKPEKGKAAKSEAAAPAGDPQLQVQLAQLAGLVTGLVKAIETQGQTVQKIAKARGLGNALSAESSGSGDRDGGGFNWPLDMNRKNTEEGHNVFG
jgi:ribosomal protein L12E/L44/L45/RPP1/RPP2